MRILVTGANGQLGNEMRIVAQGSAHSFIFTDICQLDGNDTTILDITDRDAVRALVASERIDAIVNCAAFTNVDAAETNQALAEKLNADAPENLAVVMKEAGGILVHISTDYVFGKEPYNTPCREDQTGTPTGVYGLTKLHGEQKIIASGCEHIIIRTSWLYSEFGKNFCKTMMTLTSTKPQIKVVFDQVGTPTYALDLAQAILAVLDASAQNHGASCPTVGTSCPTVRTSCPTRSGICGIYHFSNEGVCSWYDFAKMVAEYSGNTGCSILPCHSNEFPSPVQRPSYSVLDKTKIKETFGISIPYWTESLKRCVENLKKS